MTFPAMLGCLDPALLPVRHQLIYAPPNHLGALLAQQLGEVGSHQAHEQAPVDDKEEGSPVDTHPVVEGVDMTMLPVDPLQLPGLDQEAEDDECAGVGEADQAVGVRVSGGEATQLVEGAYVEENAGRWELGARIQRWKVRVEFLKIGTFKKFLPNPLPPSTTHSLTC